jgi:hypothetical protein
MQINAAFSPIWLAVDLQRIPLGVFNLKAAPLGGLFLCSAKSIPKPFMNGSYWLK